MIGERKSCIFSFLNSLRQSMMSTALYCIECNKLRGMVPPKTVGGTLWGKANDYGAPSPWHWLLLKMYHGISLHGAHMMSSPINSLPRRDFPAKKPVKGHPHLRRP